MKKQTRAKRLAKTSYEEIKELLNTTKSPDKNLIDTNLFILQALLVSIYPYLTKAEKIWLNGQYTRLSKNSMV